MEEHTRKVSDEQLGDDGPCAKSFLLCQLKEGQKDKLEHLVEEIFWIGQQYAVYRSEKGVYVQFSDSPDVEAVQRRRFTAISPELCELRYLTYEMRSHSFRRLISQTSSHPSSLYEHNMAQAVALVMEENADQGRELAKQALKMAVTRVTNDNTVKYLGCCLACWAVFITAGFISLRQLPLESQAHGFVVAAMAGVTGAMFSVATRLQNFQLHPCQQSSMNYLMASTRIGIGFVSGPLLLLLGLTVLKEPLSGLLPKMGEWQQTAVLGFIGGFAERLVPNLLKRTSSEIAAPAGTPVQAARSEETSRDAHKSDPVK
jgi:hypothetical protein